MTNKDIYSSPVLPPQQFPIAPSILPSAASPANTQSTFASPVQEPVMPPANVIASALINGSINTAMRKILDKYSFAKMGSIQIGDFIKGVSGDIKISPNGIIGEDNQGTVRFILDNNGQLILTTGNNSLILDALGIRSTTNFGNSSALANLGLNQHFSSTTYSLITGMSFTVTLTRPTNILLMGYVIGSEVYAGADSRIRGQVSIVVDGVLANVPTIAEGGVQAGVSSGFGNLTNTMMPIYEILQLGAGVHTLQLQAKRITLAAADSDFMVAGVSFFYYLLGT